MDGSLVAGSISLALLVETPFTVFPLAAQHYLNATARRALHEFRPALQIDDAQFADLEYKLTTVSARAGLIAAAIGAVLAIGALQSAPASFGLSPASSAATIAITGLFGFFIIAFFLIFIYHTLRQLSTVASIHTMAKQINLFQLGPIYAFSLLTARTGLAIILIVYYEYFFFYYLNVYGTLPSPGETVWWVSLFFVALACFVLPLNGIHRRLVQEKSRLLAEANRRMERILSALHQRVDRGEYGKVSGMQTTLAALNAEREMIDKISTWPWRSETLRGFLSSIVFPIVLYLITRLLSRFLGV